MALVAVGTTSVLVDVFISDSSSTTGAGLTGLVFNTASLTAYYHRSNGNAAVAMSLATMTLGTWATLGFVVVDGTNMPGWYQLGVPDAAFASGARQVSIILKGATNMAPCNLSFDLTAATPSVSVTQWNGTNVATPDTAGYPKVTIKSGSGTGEIATSGGAVTTVTTVTNSTSSGRPGQR